jgi:hypothetical protein
MARSRRTPAMLIHRCSWELSTQRKIKKSQAPSVPGFPTSPLSPATTYVVLCKENHMRLFVAKYREGINARGTECGNQAGREGYQNE